MADKVEFELVSPEQVLLSEPVDMVVVPGGDGDYGVLHDHIPMITTVKAGSITVYDENRVIDRIFVTGGFAEVTGDRCTILVESAVKVSTLDRATVEQEIKNLIEDKEDAKTDAEKEVAEFQLGVARARLQAIADAVASH
jgi:F-type H+-transporting ATPase subunit epsilon